MWLDQNIACWLQRSSEQLHENLILTTNWAIRFRIEIQRENAEEGKVAVWVGGRAACQKTRSEWTQGASRAKVRSSTYWRWAS